MPLMSYREYARQRNLNLKTVQDRIKSGKITQKAIVSPQSERNPGKHPKIDSEQADRDFEENGSPLQKLNAPVMKQTLQNTLDEKFKSKKPDAIAAKSHTEMIDGKETKVTVEPYRDESNTGRLTSAKATVEELKSRKLELDIMQRERQLLHVDEIKEVLTEKLQETRAALLNIPHKIAIQVLGKRDLLGIQIIIKQEINAALEALQKATDGLE